MVLKTNAKADIWISSTRGQSPTYGI